MELGSSEPSLHRRFCSSFGLASARFVCQICHMKTVLVRDFLRQFAARRNETLQVQQRGRVLGVWTPSETAPEPVDVLARAKRSCNKKLPFTGAELLKLGKKR
jgi:hypothetical protein